MLKEDNKQITICQQARWLPADMDTPISLFMGMAGSNNGVLLESAEVDGRWGRYSVLALDMALILHCTEGKLQMQILDPTFASLMDLNGSDFLPGLRAVMQRINILAPENIPALPPITRALHGYFGFGMAAIFSQKLAQTMPIQEAECTLVLPGTSLVFDHLYNRLCQISLGEHRSICGERGFQNIQTDPVTVNVDPAIASHYKSMVDQIKKMLYEGEAIQVVPSARFSLPYHGDPFQLYRKMRRFNASPYMFYMKFPELTLFGSSPEVMVRCTKGRLQLSPIAGTRRRGKDDLEDSLLAKELLSDPKEKAEHVMLVDLGRNDLGRIATTGSVRVERSMEVERFSHVMHLTSRITANLHEGLDGLDILAATFPAGTVSGAPKIRAMEIIRELEGQARGPYAGCIGWLGLDHDSVNLDMGITIRSMWHSKGILNWQAGGGIVHDSDPELEWKEVYNKSAIMRLVLNAKDDDNVSTY